MAENSQKTEEKVEKKADTPQMVSVKKQPAIVALWVVAGVLVMLVIAGGTFAVARRLEVNNLGRGNGFRTEMMNGGQMMGRGGFGRGYSLRNGGDALNANMVTGKVTAVNDKQFTISVNSTSKTVQISDTTRFPNTSATKVAVGDTVVVTGQQDGNGVIQATEISVNPSSQN